ncbi:MAG: N-acetyltransferase [Deltaproteobacteria bacterium]|jgi:amino-acid N-acetyltransferase|nr:N-acetyltransferase [Deltaproteobacteria bacterium]
MIEVRKARVDDIPAIYQLLRELAQKGLLLPRSYANLYEMVQTLFVAQDPATPTVLAGTASLQVAWEDLAEVRSLAVPEEFRGHKVGQALTIALEAEARSLRVQKMFVLTYVPVFFEKLGYEKVPLETLPQKIWAVCFNCVHYPNCQEIALVKRL